MLYSNWKCNEVVAYASTMDAGGTQRVSPSVAQWLWRRVFFFLLSSVFTCWSRVIRTRAFSRAHAHSVRVREQFLARPYATRWPVLLLLLLPSPLPDYVVRGLEQLQSSIDNIRKFMQILAVSYFISFRCGEADATFCHHLVDWRP